MLIIAIDDMITDMISNETLSPVVTELLIRSKILNISLVFTTQSYFKVPKDFWINYMYYFTMNISNKTELQKFARY